MRDESRLIWQKQVLSFWHDPWIFSLPGFRAVCRDGIQTNVTWVAELLLAGSRRWNTNLLQHLFEPHIAAAIGRIELSQSATEDKLLWIPHSKGVFSAKSMYKQLTIQLPSGSNNNSSNGVVNWSSLWQVKGIAPRVLMFLWRSLHGGVAVGARLNRIMGTNGTCKECNQHWETIDHMLILCKTVSMVWHRSGLLTRLQQGTFSIPIIFAHLLENDHDAFRHGCAIIWNTWTARNKKVFNGKPMDVNNILHQALKLYKDYKNPMDTSSDISQTVNDHQWRIADVKWILPPSGYIKINVDGAHFAGLCAAGAIARDAQGRFLGGMAKASFPGLPIEAEAQGFLLAMGLANALNANQIIVESDSKTIVDDLSNSQVQPDWRIVNTLNTCRVFQNERAGVTFNFIPREANKAAHVLATFALAHDVTTSWNGGFPPPFLLDVLFADLAHIVTTDVNNE